MTKFNPSRILAGAATAVAITLAVSGTAFAHGAGMGGMGHMGGVTEHGTTNLVTTKSLIRLGNRDGRRFHFRVGVAYLPDGCIYRWTELGRVRICPAY
jgi:hypothetical protein